MKTFRNIIWCAGFVVALTGCATRPVEINNADRLIAHAQFQQAFRAAPDFVSDALKTINRLEQELERK